MNLGFIGSPEHSGSREMDWIPAGRVSTRRNPWILEGRQYFHRPRNGIQFPDFRFIYTPILRSTISIYIKKKNPVKVADNRLPLSLHSIDFTPFSLPSNSPFLDWKVINTRDGIRWTRDECVRIFLIHRNLILVTIIIEEGRGGRSLARIDKRVSSTIRVWVGDGSWRRRISRGVEFRPKNRAREPLVGAWNIGRRFTAATARKGRARKVWHGWSKLFLPLLFPSGGEKSVEDFPSRAFQWMSDRGGREGRWKVGSWFNPFDNEKYKRASIKSIF